MTVHKIWNPPHLEIPRILKYCFYKKLLNHGAKRNRLLYLKIMYIAPRKILHLQ